MPERRQTDSAMTASVRFSSAHPGPVSPQLAQLDKRLGSLMVNRFTYRIFRMLGRLARPAFDPDGVTVDVDERSAPRLIIVRPQQRHGDGALMLFHGGGYVIGAPEDALPKATMFARMLGVPVICPEYRLAPDAPYPAAIDDALASWKKIIAMAGALSIDPTKVVIGGYSAGAGVAACLAQRLRDEGGIQPTAQLLVYPMLDDRTAERLTLDKTRHRVWSNRSNRFGWSAYIGSHSRADSLQYAAAARQTDLSGLPPAWLGVGVCDLFLDEVRDYRFRLSEAGIVTAYEEVEGAIHGFDMDNNALAQTFTESQLVFLRAYLA